ncbi:MAG: hypothetical protein JW913_20710 [Chitinispirillaceae bacterium]|nr:hypothetical protein [Chitinispirillaceae bacterium]
MPEQQNDGNNEQPEIRVHVSQDLDYSFRDVANIFVGAGEVVFEFGNHHRSMPGHITIADRIVMSIGNAYDFQMRLQNALLEAQKQIQRNLQERKAGRSK